MKKLFKVLGTQSRWLCAIAMLAALVLSFAACDDFLGLINDDDIDDQTTYTPVVYKGYDAEDKEYKLTISRPTKTPVPLTPAAGDAYELIITTAAGATQKSSGKVKEYSNNKFTLTATNATVSFEVTTQVTASGNGIITNIAGKVTVEGGGTVDGPGPLTPTSSFVAVTEITGVQTGAVVGTTTLSGTAVPSEATNKTIAWSVKSAGTTGATISGNTLTTTAAGDVTVTATIANGLTATTPYTQDFPIKITTNFVAVTEITGVPNGAVVGTTTLSGTVAPSEATNTAIVWSVKSAGTTGATISGNNLTTTAAGNVTVTATIAYGTATIAYGLTATTPYTQDFTIAITTTFVAVTGITGVPTSGTVGTPITLVGTVAPTTATNKAIAWSVKSAGTTGATISGNTLNATASGTVTVTAKIANGQTATTPYTQDFTITITGGAQTFTSIAAFTTWLGSQPANTAATAYAVKLNVSNLGSDSFTAGSAGKALKDNSDKYVNLDLSGSTFTGIGENAFYWCTSLAAVTIGSSVTSIGDWAFYGCGSLAAVTIPNSVTSIGVSAFYYCTSLAAVTIGSGVTSIGDSAFSGCLSLAEINVDSANPAYSSEEGVLYNNAKTNLIQYPAGKKSSTFTIPNSVTGIGQGAFDRCESLTAVTIRNSVTSIGDSAFYWCTSLAAVTIPNSVTTIGDHAFRNCTSLAGVTIGSGVTSIGESAFAYCYSLTAITVDSANPEYSSEDGVLYNKAKTNLIQYPAGKKSSTFTIPNSVTGIGQGAFDSCESLTTVTIGNSVTSIGDSAFAGCTRLAGVTIPNSVTSIGVSAFHGCTSLASVNIPNSVATIGEKAFYYCTSLAAVTIGNSVTSIGSEAFDSCYSLTSVTFEGTIAADNFDEYAFPGDLRDKFYADDQDNGTPGTYTRPNGSSTTWTKTRN